MRCDNAAEKAGDAAYFIMMDLDVGYWQVNMRESTGQKWHSTRQEVKSDLDPCQWEPKTPI
jgi:hypothetical protein